MNFRTYDKALTDLHDEAAARRVADLSSYLREGGWQCQEWAAQPEDPGVTKRRGLLQFASWMDHSYKLITPKGEEIFVAEPYELGRIALAELARLSRQGWRVSVRPDLALHYPGRTLAVWVRRQEGAGPTPLLDTRWLETDLIKDIEGWLRRRP